MDCQTETTLSDTPRSYPPPGRARAHPSFARLASISRRRRGNKGKLDMMITVSELEAIIAQTLAGEQVQYEGKPIGSIDQMTRKLTELKLKRSGDPDYLIFVGIDRFGECFLTAFSTMSDLWEFRLRHDK